MTIELTITIKDSERTYKQKFLVYEPISMTPNDPIICKSIDEARVNFQGEPEDIVVRAMMVFT